MHPNVSDGDEVYVAVYCRPTTDAVAPLSSHHERLSRLSRAGVIDALAVEEWPSLVSVVPADTPENLPGERTTAVRVRRRFEEWANGAGVDLGPAFGHRAYESATTGESGELYRFPVVALAVHVDGDLAAVYPHEDDGPGTVETGIDRLAGETGERATRPDGERPRPAGD